MVAGAQVVAAACDPACCHLPSSWPGCSFWGCRTLSWQWKYL